MKNTSNSNIRNNSDDDNNNTHETRQNNNKDIHERNNDIDTHDDDDNDNNKTTSANAVGEGIRQHIARRAFLAKILEGCSVLGLRRPTERGPSAEGGVLFQPLFEGGVPLLAVQGVHHVARIERLRCNV